jgi:hypothetical protein
MTTNFATPATDRPTARSSARILPGAAGLLFAGVQLDAGIIAAALRGMSIVPEDRLSFPFSGAAATATSLVWGLAQALFLVTLLAFARSGAVGTSRPGRFGARLALVAGVVFVVAHTVSLMFRDARMDEPVGVTVVTLFAIASVLTAVGFILAGVAVAKAGRWTGWRRYPVAAIGIWMLCMVPLQFTALLPLSVVIYAATIAAFSTALLAEPDDRA